MKNRRPFNIAALAFAALLVAVAVGCGGSDSSDNSSSSGSASTTGQQRQGAPAEVQECLEEQGVDLPSPPAGGQGGAPPDGQGVPPLPGGTPGQGGAPLGGRPGGEDPEFREALEECGVDPSRRPGGPRGGGAEFGASIEKFAKCVRRNGYDLPDPNTSGGGPVFDPEQVDQNDPQFVKASKKCQDTLRPAQPEDG